MSAVVLASTVTRSTNLVFPENNMGIFGNYTLANGTRIHNETETDVIMNYTCGGIFLAAVVVGVLVNTYLIYYYKKRQTDWSHRFYFRLAIAYLVYMIIRGVPTTCRLLDPNYSPDTSDNSNWSKELLEVLNIACYIDGAVITTFVAVIVMVQYKNIHDPGWIILNDSRKFWKPIVIAISSLYLAAFTTSLVLLVTYLGEDGTTIPDKIWHIYKLLFEVPLLIITAVAPCVYLVTRVKFRPLERQLDVNTRDKIRREFRLVHIMMVWNVVWFLATVTYLVLLYCDNNFHYSPDYYIAVVCCDMEPTIQAVFVACAIFFNDKGLRDSIFGRMTIEGYERINGDRE